MHFVLIWQVQGGGKRVNAFTPSTRRGAWLVKRVYLYAWRLSTARALSGMHGRVLYTAHIKLALSRGLSYIYSCVLTFLQAIYKSRTNAKWETEARKRPRPSIRFKGLWRVEPPSYSTTLCEIVLYSRSPVPSLLLDLGVSTRFKNPLFRECVAPPRPRVCPPPRPPAAPCWPQPFRKQSFLEGKADVTLICSSRLKSFLGGGKHTGSRHGLGASLEHGRYGFQPG